MKTSENTPDPTRFVATVDIKLASKIKQDLLNQGFEFSTMQYTLFAAKKKGVTCVFYTSGKLTVQGKGTKEFLEFYLEPIILKDFPLTYASQGIIKNPNSIEIAHIGIDESGKGDFFGPLCVAGVYASPETIQRLKNLGVKDSKQMNDAAILKLAKIIRQECTYHIVKINPEKYNELYEQFKNLNHLLAWGHATAIELLAAKTNCRTVIIDQFASEHVVVNALKRKKLSMELTQRHRGEEDVVVAAASILARETFLQGLDALSKQFLLKLPKGASKQTIECAKAFVIKYGKEALRQVSKLHFKTYHAVY